jgi:hypothetical protein
MNVLDIFIEIKFDLFNLLKNLINSKIENLKIYINDNDVTINSKILLKNIKNLEIEGYNINNFLFHFFNNIELPNLQKYILNTDINNINNQILISNNNDYKIINQFIIDTLNNKNKFDLKTFFYLPNQLKFIQHIQLNFQFFSFTYKKKGGKNHLFKFNINNKNEFNQYYSNIDLTIDENEIIKYKKIDIKGINDENKKNIIEIIEKEDINLCDIYFNLNLNQYFIKSFKNLRSIYSENEVNYSILNKLLNHNMNNLKYINLIIDDISNNFYDILSKIIKSPNLKSLILKLHSNNFNNNNIIDLFKLIENSKKLRIINITQNNNDKYDINIKEILEQFPKLEKRKYYFDEFIIE